MIYLQLFLAFAQIGLFSFGGGYAAVPLIQSQIVEIHHWMEMDQFADLITIAEMTPGPIAINCATFVGQQVAGVPGAILCTLGYVAPPFFDRAVSDSPVYEIQNSSGGAGHNHRTSPRCCCHDRFGSTVTSGSGSI